MREGQPLYIACAERYILLDIGIFLFHSSLIFTMEHLRRVDDKKKMIPSCETARGVHSVLGRRIDGEVCLTVKTLLAAPR